MSILGALVRTLPEHLATVGARLGTLPGLDLALNPGDGRLVVVIEDLDGQNASAAETLSSITHWPEVLSTSLVYEYSGPDAPAAADTQNMDFRSWRESLSKIKRDAGLEPVQGHLQPPSAR